MPEEQDIELKELQEHVEEAHHHATHPWTKYIALTTSGLAAFAAIGALKSGSMVNEVMIEQLKASDTWNQYQADRQKSHLYLIAANSIADSGQSSKATLEGGKPASKRLEEYLAQVEHEKSKTDELQKTAKELEKSSRERMEIHERFSYSVALLQVAIALGAVSALTRNRWVWYGSMATGLAGIVYFVLGFMGK